MTEAPERKWSHWNGTYINCRNGYNVKVITLVDRSVFAWTVSTPAYPPSIVAAGKAATLPSAKSAAIQAASNREECI